MNPNTSNSVFVDVDGSLIVAGEPNSKLIAWLKVQKQAGYPLILWSMRGAGYAREAAQKLNITDLFEAIISKPRFVVDDKGWQWIKFAWAVPFFEIQAGKNLPKIASG